MVKNKIERNIKILVVFFCITFFVIILYLTCFNLFFADRISQDECNRRLKYEENEVLRGSILDRNGNAVAYSKRVDANNQKRMYNDAKYFSHIIGYDSIIYGKTGIEKAYNNVLQRKDYENGIIRSFFRGLKENLNKDDKKGNDVYLTIDKKLQETAYDKLGDNKGAAVAINPKTGEILSMVSKPGFDPEVIDQKYKDYNTDNEGTPLINRAVRGYYPPGSTFKVITAASALENIPGIENKTYKCTGALKLGKYKLKCFNGEVHGRVDLYKAFEESCNFTFGSVGIELGFDKLKTTAEDFMFNKDIELNDKYNPFNIKEGQFQIANKNYKGLIAQNAIGQNGVTVSPIHMALVAGAIANDGVMMKPYIVRLTKDRYGVTLNETEPEVLTTAAPKNITDKLKKYMIGVVKRGTGTKAKISGIQVAGKTGTAENVENKEPHSWFIAFAPADNPKIAVAVIVENGGTGGKKAASIARDMIKEYLKK